MESDMLLWLESFADLLDDTDFHENGIRASSARATDHFVQQRVDQVLV